MAKWFEALNSTNVQHLVKSDQIRHIDRDMSVRLSCMKLRIEEEIKLYLSLSCNLDNIHTNFAFGQIFQHSRNRQNCKSRIVIFGGTHDT